MEATCKASNKGLCGVSSAGTITNSILYMYSGWAGEVNTLPTKINNYIVVAIYL